LNEWIRERERKRQNRFVAFGWQPMEPERGFRAAIRRLSLDVESSIESLLEPGEEIRYSLYAEANPAGTPRNHVPVYLVVTDRTVVVMRAGLGQYGRPGQARQVLDRLPPETTFGPLLRRPKDRWSDRWGTRWGAYYYVVIKGTEYGLTRGKYKWARDEDAFAATEYGEIRRFPD
jgi:hypothetical protein